MPDGACDGEQEQEGADQIEQELGCSHGKGKEGGKYQRCEWGEGGIGYEFCLVPCCRDVVIEGLHVIGSPIIAAEQEAAARVIAGKVGPGHHL